MNEITKHEHQLNRLARRLMRVFGCDTARISRPLGSAGAMFLVIGRNRNTRRDRLENHRWGQWYRNGKSIDFDYLSEQVVASGATIKDLIVSAKHYKKACDNVGRIR